MEFSLVVWYPVPGRSGLAYSGLECQKEVAGVQTSSADREDSRLPPNQHFKTESGQYSKTKKPTLFYTGAAYESLVTLEDADRTVSCIIDYRKRVCTLILV